MSDASQASADVNAVSCRQQQLAWEEVGLVCLDIASMTQDRSGFFMVHYEGNKSASRVRSVWRMLH